MTKVAKARSQLKPEKGTKKVKTYVSSSGIFKKIGSHRSIAPAPRRSLHPQEQNSHRSAHDLRPYSKKQARPPAHLLATAFNGFAFPTPVVLLNSVLTVAPERIEQSREHIEATAIACTDSAHHSLTDRLASASAQPDKLIKAAIALKEEQFRPFGEEQLQFASADGTSKVKALLGDCIQSFKKVVDHEEKALAVLWKEWTEVQLQIEEFAKEMLGPDGIRQFRNSKESGLGGQCGAQQKTLEQDVELDRKGWEEEVEKINQQAMQKLLASEKEMDFLQKKQKRSILSMWEAQL
ncbi:hypothetical protein LPUS_11467 [Lasallia pustulata]|uniref:Uncharacterized protein n=1 Tax=Lasallia pustulata TaxID=136370 RepID=A0A1W5DC54_9LECA|nr:hypothetical protein LPUS_11467 [Lasallia pustulata]